MQRGKSGFVVSLCLWLTWFHRLEMVPEKVLSFHVTIFWEKQPKAEDGKYIYVYTFRGLSKRKIRMLNRIALVASGRIDLSVSKALCILSKTVTKKVVLYYLLRGSPAKETAGTKNS